VSAGVTALARGGDPALLERILAAGMPVGRFVFRNLRGGEIEAAPAEHPADAPPSLLIHRSAILEALLDGFDRRQLRGGHELIGWSERSEGVEARFANGEAWSGDLLIGADGRALNHWGFFHEEPLPPSRQEQCLPVGHRYQTSSQEVSNRIGRARRPDPGPAVRRIATA